jgi:hypothetical protein
VSISMYYRPCGYLIKHIGSTPRTISKEYQEAMNERAVEQKMNPLTGEKSDVYRNSRAHIGEFTRYYLGGLQGYWICCFPRLKCLRERCSVVGFKVGCSWVTRHPTQIFHLFPDITPTTPATSFLLPVCIKLKYRTCFYLFLW